MCEQNKEDNEKNIEFKKWIFYQETARHFNELIIDLRTKSLTVVVSLSAASLIISQKLIVQFISNFIISCAIFVIYLFWKCIYIIDIYYYQNLLIGTVQTILESEESDKLGLNLSRNISKSTSEKFTSLFYNISSSILLILSLIFIMIWKDTVENKNNIDIDRMSKLLQSKNIDLSLIFYGEYKLWIYAYLYLLISILILEFFLIIKNVYYIKFKK